MTHRTSILAVATIALALGISASTSFAVDQSELYPGGHEPGAPVLDSQGGNNGGGDGGNGGQSNGGVVRSAGRGVPSASSQQSGAPSQLGDLIGTIVFLLQPYAILP